MKARNAAFETGFQLMSTVSGLSPGLLDGLPYPTRPQFSGRNYRRSYILRIFGAGAAYSDFQRHQ